MVGIVNLLKERVAIAKVSSDNSDYLIRVTIKEGEDGISELQKQTETRELPEGTRQRVVQSLGRLVAEAKHREDDCRGNLDNGSKGGYSDYLNEAIKLLDALRKGTQVPDEDALQAAYRLGFEDAKKTILQNVQKLASVKKGGA